MQWENESAQKSTSKHSTIITRDTEQKHRKRHRDNNNNNNIYYTAMAWANNFILLSASMPSLLGYLCSWFIFFSQEWFISLNSIKRLHDIVIFIVYSTEIARTQILWIAYYMVIDTLWKTTKNEKKNRHARCIHIHTLNKTRRKWRTRWWWANMLETVQLMTFILLSTNAQDKNDRLNKWLDRFCPFAISSERWPAYEEN